MAIEEAKTSVKMKFMGHFQGAEKVVQLPIPLVSNSMKLDQTLVFTREKKGAAAVCEVPIEWVGALQTLGGSWQLAEKVSPATQFAIDAARAETEAKMKRLALENELVEA